MSNSRARFNDDGSSADRYTEEQASAARSELSGCLPYGVSDQAAYGTYVNLTEEENDDDDYTEKEDPSLYE